MFDPNSPDLTRPVPTITHDGPDVPAFFSRHRSFFVLVAVVLAQLLLLSVQITRNRNVRLIRYWAVAVFDPFERSLRGLLDFSSSAYTTYDHLWHAQQENQELHIQLVAAQSRLQQLTEQVGETERLRNLLEFKNQLTFQTVGAEVIASSPEKIPTPSSSIRVPMPGFRPTLRLSPRKEWWAKLWRSSPRAPKSFCSPTPPAVSA